MLSQRHKNAPARNDDPRRIVCFSFMGVVLAYFRGNVVTILWSCWDHIRDMLEHAVIILYHTGFTKESHWGHLRVILGSCWGHVGILLGVISPDRPSRQIGCDMQFQARKSPARLATLSRDCARQTGGQLAPDWAPRQIEKVCQAGPASWTPDR